MAQSNHVQHVAIVGASGRTGKHFVEELLKTGKHTVTALTRVGSNINVPSGVKIAEVDYNNEDSVVSALNGQQFLAITLSVMAPPDTHSKIVRAAVKAGVLYIMPNVYGYDIFNQSMCDTTPHGKVVLENTLEIEKLGASYIAMVCGQWYEWSMALNKECFGFDFANKKVTFFDDGKTAINLSTWGQCGRALAALLSLPIDSASPSLSDWKIKALYIDSFKVSQRDMLDSIHRVKGTSDVDWEISYEPSEKRYKDGMREIQEGSRTGFAKALYGRAFFPNGGGDFESTRGLANDVLGLQKENVDEATKRALEMVERGWNPFAQ